MKNKINEEEVKESKEKQQEKEKSNTVGNQEKINKNGMSSIEKQKKVNNAKIKDIQKQGKVNKTEITDIQKQEEVDKIIEEIEASIEDNRNKYTINDLKKIANETIKKMQAKLKKWQKSDIEVKITFKRVLAYFIIYSFLGFIVETLYGIVTKGVVESRQSCLYGPFCCIYGLGAAIMIPGLQKFKKSNWGLFIAGAIEGSAVEYVASWIGELIFQIKWWDYSNLPFDINGRICLLFAVFWGMLALGLIRFINPYIDYIIDKMPKKLYTAFTVLGTIFLIIDLIFTAFGLKVFYTKLVRDYNIELKNESALVLSEEIFEDQNIQYLSETVFSNEKMLRTFPNIKYEDKSGNIVWVKDILTDIQPYYFKISNKFRLK